MHKTSAVKAILLTTSLALPTAATSATNYYWESNPHIGADNDIRIYKGNSPAEVCDQIAAAGWQYDYYYSGLKRVTDKNFRCTSFRKIDKYTAWTEIYRYGDTCPPETAFQSANPYNKTCRPPEEKGPPEHCSPTTSYAGNPVNFSTGNKYQEELDYQAPGNPELNLSHTYNSSDSLWRHSFSTQLQISQDGQSVALIMGNGKERYFTVNGTNITPTSYGSGVLKKTETGWTYTSIENTTYTFSNSGDLTSWLNANGNLQQLTYNGNLLTISDSLSNTVTLTVDPDKQPLSFSAPGITIAFTYSDRRLTKLTRTSPSGTTQRIYHYEDTNNSSLLTGITDENGERYAIWRYDTLGRAISSEHAYGAEKVTITYNGDGSTTVTNEYGKRANYQFQAIQGTKRITSIEGELTTNCPSSNSSFTYDEHGLIKTRIDNKGNLTTYDYNDRNLETSRTEASGTPEARTITTEWHPTLYLKTKVTEPNRITIYQYDAQGRPLGQIITPR
ncbi:DUF6531 domain-containing protein [Pseudomonas sp. ZM23]|uniref:DUF6531 domain-containing protein n=1 Tax=Pseudomonas triclosanedens TaxID=2961893 RepID=A0ABY6ZZ75_9PSED|nr:DUF6531 domain-containing protein [Pseudomonas triclosanedens]MCP8467469.1 DUF6531 domain-containing protein [Pseudomonas triclosanedens]MCP8469831.1 DUF6531 domain-containing protein [Pseudomonas triclosanedens]MCP8478858.1 DUF6531 domain-containing protein [Pseudomonas triclosanedens]WAI49164.1 DUF6531 domain-containing protein [Pseudomonas triclosanedens]